MQGLASQSKVSLAHGFVLRRMSVDQGGHILGVGLPVDDELAFADQFAHSGPDHVDSHDGTVVDADQLDETGGGQDLALAVSAQVVFVGGG